MQKVFFTTMGLKYPLKKFDSQWLFPMGIPYLVKIAIYGTQHFFRCLATWPRNVTRERSCHAGAFWRHRSLHVNKATSIPLTVRFVYLFYGTSQIKNLPLKYRITAFQHSVRSFIWELFTMQYLPGGNWQTHWYWPSFGNVIGLCQQRRKPASFPDHLMFIYLMGRGRNRFFNLCGGVGHFLHSEIEFSSWKKCPSPPHALKNLYILTVHVNLFAQIYSTRGQRRKTFLMCYSR